MEIETFEPGAIVFAKLRGFPWWPGVVVSECEIPKKVFEKKAKGQDFFICVKFIGSNDYGWVNELKMFTEKEANDKLATIAKGSRLAKSINEALKTTNLRKISMTKTKGDDESSDELSDVLSDVSSDELSDVLSDVSSDESSDESSEEEQIASNDYNKVEAVEQTKQSEQSIIIKEINEKNEIDITTDGVNTSSPSIIKKVGEEENLPEKILIQEEIITSENQSNFKDHELEKNSSEKSEEEQISNNDHTEEEEVSKEETNNQSNQSGHKRLLRLRHLLQKLALRGEISNANMRIIDEIFKEIENTYITIEMLKKCKLGIIMRKISKKTIDNDIFNIVGRGKILMDKWKAMLEAKLLKEDKFSSEASPFLFL